MDDIVVLEDVNFSRLLAEEISGDPNNLDCLTKSNLANIKELYSTTMLIERKEEDKIKSIRGIEWCINLRQLHLIDHAIKDIGCLYDLEHFEVVNLRKNDISDIYPIVEKTTIKTLVIAQNKVEDVAILQTLKGLESLYIQENPIKNKSILFLNELKNLRKLCVWETNDSIIKEVNHFNKSITIYADKKSNGAA